MFASPLSAPLHQSLVSHVFGRFLPSRAPAAMGGGESTMVSAPLASVAPNTAVVSAAAADPGPQVASESADDEAWPDLAQRVREVGEW